MKSLQHLSLKYRLVRIFRIVSKTSVDSLFRCFVLLQLHKKACYRKSKKQVMFSVVTCVSGNHPKVMECTPVTINDHRLIAINLLLMIIIIVKLICNRSEKSQKRPNNWFKPN